MKKDNSKNFGAYLDRTLKIIKHNYISEFKRIKADITTEQWMLIDSLFQNNGQSQKELASNSFKNAPTVSRIIDLLCYKELVERRKKETDKRAFNIFLTQKGYELYHKVKPVVIQLRLKGWQNLNDEQYDSFVKIMNRIYENFSE